MNKYCEFCQVRITNNRGFMEELNLCNKCEETLPGFTEFKAEWMEYEKESLQRKKKIEQCQNRIDENKLKIRKELDRIVYGK